MFCCLCRTSHCAQGCKFVTFSQAGGCLDQENIKVSNTQCVNISITPLQKALNSARNKLQSLKIGPTDAEIVFDKVWAITWDSSTFMYSKTAFVDKSIPPLSQMHHSANNKLQSLKIGLTDSEILFDKVWAITWDYSTFMYSKTAFVDTSIPALSQMLHSAKKLQSFKIGPTMPRYCLTKS